MAISEISPPQSRERDDANSLPQTQETVSNQNNLGKNSAKNTSSGVTTSNPR